MSDTTRTLQEYDRRYLWHPFTQMKEWEKTDPIVIERGEGSWLIDTDGNRYLDGVAAIWTNVHGHCRREINEAIKEQVDRLEHSTLLGLTNDKAALLAKRLVDIAPPGLARVFYSDNGSTAVEIGVKMAFQYWQHLGRPEKQRYISFRNAYHGDTVGCMSVGGIDIYHEVFRPLLFPTIQAPSPYCYRCELCAERDADRCGRQCLQELERLMAAHTHETAGLVIEPLVQGAGGMIVQPEGFVRKVRELCDRYDILMIADEVAVGFGRTGTMFACQQEGVTPDIMALSKGITAGYLPLAATMTTEKVYNAFLGEYRELKTFFHGHTFTGNPIACATALASLDLFASDRLLEQLPAKIDYLRQRLEPLRELDHVGNIRMCGMVGGIELVRSRETREPYDWEERIGVRVCLEAQKHGLFLRPLGNIIVVFPPLSISLEELAFLMDGIDASIRAITG
ncbi:adenosylmethionine--8-amino-7-oxononanoate transaminase [Geobacter argillaceus]|uniref:Adenosylmethionine-8-amino-7-oxononanoate aminotransferase n=1 Tax=Geobacter argillaceus TaxID=345631 RepID=A0A562VHM1_9BACT|nr:adenosylmethionine--8-amino-7-oxononanoate transaminase [Geobacter argillaceus]TWJ17348.1 adenosylmethionine-8-amino-7-oxononanoate aminotransferase apoenzyme [Geobacter argillaceus]